jgi:hypothetical protein
MKMQRWYEVLDGMLHVYNNGHKQYATSVSIASLSDMKFYRNNFTLRKLWTN